MSNGKNTNKSYESQVGKVTGASAEAGDAVIQMPKGLNAMVRKPSKEEIAGMMADDSLEFAPQVHSMEEGDFIEGILEGRGKGAEFTQKDPATGLDVTRHVDTWIILMEGTGLRMSILSSAQLDEKLPPFEGGKVSIYHGGQIKTSNQRRVNVFTVFGPKKTDGTTRTFARKSERVLDVPASAMQSRLSAPSAQDGGEDAIA